MLHLIFQSVIDYTLIDRIGCGDAVVFLENAVLRTLKNTSSQELLVHLLNNNRICVMSDQLEIRGIKMIDIIQGIDIIDYAELVELTIKYPVIQSWN